MPTAWNRTPEEFHKIYVANTDAFYRVGSIALAEELDKFMTSCALGLWSKAGSITQYNKFRLEESRFKMQAFCHETISENLSC